MNKDIEERLNYLEHAIVDLLYLARCQGWKFDYPAPETVTAIRLVNEGKNERT